MEQPEPAADMPDGPISAAEASGYLDEPGVVAVWVMDPDSDVRSVAVLTCATHQDDVIGRFRTGLQTQQHLTASLGTR